MRISQLAVALVVVTAVALAERSSSAQTQLGIPAQITSFAPATSLETYPTLDFGQSTSEGDDRVGTTEWRVVKRTGNCCENYLTTSKEGRLFDFGGGTVNRLSGGGNVNFTNNGTTWYYVQSLPIRGPEGAGVMTPNGDVVGVSWDPYRGDLLESFKYEAATGQWFYTEALLHTPFYDRPFIAVVPGPITTHTGATVPYISVAVGGAGEANGRELLFLYSTDGLNYTYASSKFVAQTLGVTQTGPLPVIRTAGADWIQSNTNSGLTPLGGGKLLSRPDELGEASGSTDLWAIFDGANGTFTGFRFPGGVVPEGRFQIDSLGRVHNVIPQGTGFTYRVSLDGGQHWFSTYVPLRPGSAFSDASPLLWDFRANAVVGLAAVTVHAWDATTLTDRDLLFKLDITGKAPKLLRRYEVGRGDINATHSFSTEDQLRFDFSSVAIYPDRRVAVSFMDSTTVRGEGTFGYPGIAIEGATTLKPPRQPDPSTVGTAQPSLQGAVIIPAPGPQRVIGMTSAVFEFDVVAGADNAALTVEATPGASADVDLYLQRRLPDGTWSEYMDKGTSDSLSGEVLNTGRLESGHYRLEVYEYLGPLNLSVSLLLTFFNSNGIAGT